MGRLQLLFSRSTFQPPWCCAERGWEQRGEVGAVREVVGGVTVMGRMSRLLAEEADGAGVTPT